MTENDEIEGLQDLMFTDMMNRWNLKPLTTPVYSVDFPSIENFSRIAGKSEQAGAAAASSAPIDRETQLGFYDLQIPKSTATSHHERKLSLILDLDQTLVHATKMTEMFSDIIAPYLAAAATAAPPMNVFENFVINNFLKTCNPKYIESFTSRVEFSADSMVPPVPGMVAHAAGGEPRQLLVTWLEGEMYFIKLRPGLRQFLYELSQIYALHIYTKANRNYLNFLINELDPCGKLFASAVARDDSPDLDVELKEINRVCCRPVDQIVVFDDRVDIWTDSQNNVIRAQPYNFLSHRKISVIKALEDIVNVSQSPVATHSAVALDFDCHLHYMKDILTRVHAEYMQKNCKTPVTQILSSLRRSILGGLTVMFTGFTDLSSFIKEAEDFGATCRANGLLPEDTEKAVENPDKFVLVAAKHTKRVYDTKKESPFVKILHGAWLDHVRATWTLPELSMFDHIRFRVNPDGTFGAMDNWEVAWIAANQSDTLGGISSAMSVVSSNRDMKKRRRA